MNAIAMTLCGEKMTFGRFVLLVSFVITSLPFATAQTAVNLPPDTLQFYKNYFVTGDYVVAGVALRGTGDSTGFATGRLSTTNSTDIPPDAVVVAAFMYWITVESTPAPSAQAGYFQGFPIIGKTVPNDSGSTPPCWSAGGGTGTSGGSKVSRIYRADVRRYMILNGAFNNSGWVSDSNGQLQRVGFQVKLPDSGSSGAGTPLTLGASLVIVYRRLPVKNASGQFVPPLKAVMIYDGAWTMNNANRYMSQTLVNFYDSTTADSTNTGTAPAGKLSLIAGNGQSNFGEQLTFFTTNSAGTIVDDSSKNTTILNPLNMPWGQSSTSPYSVSMSEDSAKAAIYISPTSSNTDCVNFAGVVLSTPVKDTDNDGLLDRWETEQGYRYPDTADGALIHLDGASSTKPDIFVQFDYLTKAPTTGLPPVPGHSHLPKFAALTRIGNAFAAQDISIHFDVGNAYPSSDQTFLLPAASSASKSFDEGSIVCTNQTNDLCPFPGMVGVLGWKSGLSGIRTNSWKASGQQGRKDSYRYILMGHTLGFASQNWAMFNGSMKSIVVNGSSALINVPNHGLSKNALVTISGIVSTLPTAGSTASLNGTYQVTKATLDTLTVGLPFTYPTGTFTYGIDATKPLGVTSGISSTFYNEPGAVLSSGSPRSTSGFSDLGGGDSIITVGQWASDNPADDQVGSELVQAGTIMHELGHELGLTHGGFDPATKTFGQNCKPNVQSVMNYLFQIRGIPAGFSGLVPMYQVDYSDVELPTLNESGAAETVGIGASPKYPGTRWYSKPGYLDDILQASAGGRYARAHCDGSPITNDPNTVRVEWPTDPLQQNTFGVDWNNDGTVTNTSFTWDFDFNGVKNEPLGGYSDWQHTPGASDWSHMWLNQISARRNAGGFSTGVGGSEILGGGSEILGGGSEILGGGSEILGGGSEILGGGSEILGGGSEILGGGSELDFERANSVVDAPIALTASATGKSVTLNWQPPAFGQIRTYFVWRADVTKVAMSQTNPPTLKISLPAVPNPTWTDTNVKTNATYVYFVTDALAAVGNTPGVQSGPSNNVQIVAK